jgi:hypothetical protein
LSSSLSSNSTYYDYIIFALEEGFPFFVAAGLYFLAFLFMLYYIRNLAAFKGSTLSQHSVTRGKRKICKEVAMTSIGHVKPKKSSAQFMDDDDDDENQFFYKI